MGSTLIKGVQIVNEGTITPGSVLIEGEVIKEILPPNTHIEADHVISGGGLYLLPGIIDDHVHFRDPGLTHKANMATESRAAAAGGVTTIFDMPNCKPTTTTLQALEDKYQHASECCLVNYSFYLGADSENLRLIESLDPSVNCGIKLFMGSSTGNMLLSDPKMLDALFRCTPMPIAAHCEETPIIDRNMQHWTDRLGCEPPVQYHPQIRSAEACYESSAKAVELASAAGAHLHVLHITTAKELSLFEDGPVQGKKITAEACPAHLFFTDKDYAVQGTRIKCNPAVKSVIDRDSLRSQLSVDGRIDVIGTDHAPHLLSEKQGGCKSAASGMPLLPYSVPSMMTLVNEGVMSMTDLVQKMCHNPAILFGIKERGFIRPGYKADLTLVSTRPQIGNAKNNFCGWNPFEGYQLGGTVHYTWVNGQLAFADGTIDSSVRGERVLFSR